jgi:hypothetical protein
MQIHFSKTSQYQISWISVQQFSNSHMHRQRDRRAVRAILVGSLHIWDCTKEYAMCVSCRQCVWVLLPTLLLIKSTRHIDKNLKKRYKTCALDTKQMFTDIFKAFLTTYGKDFITVPSATNVNIILKNQSFLCDSENVQKGTHVAKN